jgi:hypothetical protein
MSLSLILLKPFAGPPHSQVDSFSFLCLLLLHTDINVWTHTHIHTYIHTYIHRAGWVHCLLFEYSYTRSRPARKDAANQNLLRQNFIAYIFRSKSVTPPPQKRKRNPIPIKESYPSPRTYHSLIGCSPWPSCRHGEGRAHGVENYPWHMRRLFVYHLEHSCQRHLVTANVGAASHRVYRF